MGRTSVLSEICSAAALESSAVLSFAILSICLVFRGWVWDLECLFISLITGRQLQGLPYARLIPQYLPGHLVGNPAVALKLVYGGVYRLLPKNPTRNHNPSHRRVPYGHAPHGHAPYGYTRHGNNLMSVYLTGVHLTGMYLTGVYFMGMYFIGVHLTDMSLIGCLYLIGVHLVGAYLIGLHLMGVHLRACVSRA